MTAARMPSAPACDAVGGGVVVALSVEICDATDPPPLSTWATGAMTLALELEGVAGVELEGDDVLEVDVEGLACVGFPVALPANLLLEVDTSWV